jgi:hypothetical protein
MTARSSGVLAVATSLLLAACGAAESEPAPGAAGHPAGDAVAIEVRAAADAPQSGGGSAVPGLWLLAVAQQSVPAGDPRPSVAKLRAQGAEVVRTDRRGRATLRRTSGPVAL